METEEFTLYVAYLASGVTVIGLLLQFILKSRCTRLSCFGRECLVRDVLPANMSELQIPNVNVVSRT